MAKTELKTDSANLALRAAAIVGVIYGIGFLLMPYSMFQLSHGCCSREARLGWLSPWDAAMWHWNANGARE